MYLCCAVDDEGAVLDILVQAERDKRAALKLMRKLLKKYGVAPEHWITDKLPSYGAALRPLGAALSRQLAGGARQLNSCPDQAAAVAIVHASAAFALNWRRTRRDVR